LQDDSRRTNGAMIATEGRLSRTCAQSHAWRKKEAGGKKNINVGKKKHYRTRSAKELKKGGRKTENRLADVISKGEVNCRVQTMLKTEGGSLISARGGGAEGRKRRDGVPGHRRRLGRNQGWGSEKTSCGRSYLK